MLSIAAGPGPIVHITGHGLAIDDDYTLEPGVTVTAERPEPGTSFGTTVEELPAFAALMVMEAMATFSLRIEHPDGGAALAAKALDALRLFDLLGLAVSYPVFPLYSIAEGAGRKLANRNLVITPMTTVVQIGARSLAWAADHTERHRRLLEDPRVLNAQRYLANAFYLADDEAKVMLMWAGIEGLLGVDSEISRRLALHAAILFDGDAEAKAQHYAEVRKAYGVRSKVVHGARVTTEDCAAASAFADALLRRLLRKIVELGRIPAAAEFDRLAASALIS